MCAYTESFGQHSGKPITHAVYKLTAYTPNAGRMVSHTKGFDSVSELSNAVRTGNNFT